MNATRPYRRVIGSAALGCWLLFGVSTPQAQDDDGITEQPAFDAPPPPELDAGNLPAIRSKGNDCFQRGNVRDFKSLDRKRLVVFAPSRKHPYLVEVSPTCIGLKFSETIAFQSRDSRICPFGGDDLLVERSRCSIVSISRLDSIEYEMVKARYGRKK